MNPKKSSRRVIETIDVTPSVRATTVVKEDAWAWQVMCEGGCGRRCSVAKTEYVPVTMTNPSGEVRAYTRKFPGQRWCVICGLRRMGD